MRKKTKRRLKALETSVRRSDMLWGIALDLIRGKGQISLEEQWRNKNANTASKINKILDSKGNELRRIEVNLKNKIIEDERHGKDVSVLKGKHELLTEILEL